MSSLSGRQVGIGSMSANGTKLTFRQVPNTFRVLAERNVAHTRELYEGSNLRDPVSRISARSVTDFGSKRGI
jgi:hypothetical protein